jgi:hypothetical protein
MKKSDGESKIAFMDQTGELYVLRKKERILLRAILSVTLEIQSRKRNGGKSLIENMVQNRFKQSRIFSGKWAVLRKLD